MSSKIIKVMLVDDHSLVREGLRLIIESQSDIRIIMDAKDGEEAIKKAKSSKPDIILMDINMPVLNGLEALRIMNDLGIRSKVIILTAYKNKEYILEATKMGAKGYLFKDSESAHLIKAIREVNIGRSYMEPSVANILMQTTYEDKSDKNLEMEKIDALSRREYEVLALLSTGLNNKAIGEELFISEKTVKNHITQVFKKLEVKDRVQAAHFAYNNSIKHTKSL